MKYEELCNNYSEYLDNFDDLDDIPDDDPVEKAVHMIEMMIDHTASFIRDVYEQHIRENADITIDADGKIQIITPEFQAGQQDTGLGWKMDEKTISLLTKGTE